jgi:hypothetical protein
MDPSEIRSSLEERLEFASRVVSTDGALVAYRLNTPGRWIARSDDWARVQGAAALARAFDADMNRGQSGFDYGQRCVSAVGGRGLFLVDRSRAGALCDALDAGFRARTGGQALTATWVPLDPSGRADAQALALTRLKRELAIAQDAAEAVDAPGLGVAAVGRCPSCAAPLPERTSAPCASCEAALTVGGQGDFASEWVVAVAVERVFDRLMPLLTRLIDLAVVGEVLDGISARALAAAGAGPVLGGDDGRAFLMRGADALRWVQRFSDAFTAEVDRTVWSMDLPEKAQAAFAELGATVSLAMGHRAEGLGHVLARAEAGLLVAQRTRAQAESRGAVAFAGHGASLEAWPALCAAAERLAQVPAEERAAPWLRVRDTLPETTEIISSAVALEACAAIAGSPAWRAYLGGAWMDANGCLQALPDARLRALATLQAFGGER